MGAGVSLRCLGAILGRSLDTVRRYARAWQDQAPQVLSQFVQWVLESRPDFALPATARRQRARPGREHIIDLAVWARRLEVALVPKNAQADTPGWSAVNLLLQGSPHWL